MEYIRRRASRMSESLIVFIFWGFGGFGGLSHYYYSLSLFILYLPTVLFTLPVFTRHGLLKYYIIIFLILIHMEGIEI